jgi:hypothetical protein
MRFEETFNDLTMEDLDFILESLKYTQQKFENYNYPTYEIKMKRVKYAQTVRAKFQRLVSELKKM